MEFKGYFRRQLKMRKVGILFEFVRVLILMFFLTAILYFPLRTLYETIGIETENYFYILTFAILLIVYVIYTNKLQFTGFYTKGAKKMSPKITWSILSISFLLISVPIIINYIS